MPPIRMRLTCLAEKGLKKVEQQRREQEAVFWRLVVDSAFDSRVDFTIAAAGGRIDASITSWATEPGDWSTLLPDGYRGEWTTPSPPPSGESRMIVRRLNVIDRPTVGDRRERLARAQARRGGDRPRHRAFTTAIEHEMVIPCLPAVPSLRRSSLFNSGRLLQILSDLGNASITTTITRVPEKERAEAAEVYSALAGPPPTNSPPSRGVERRLESTALRLGKPAESLRLAFTTATAPSACQADAILRTWAGRWGGSALRVVHPVTPFWRLGDDPTLADQLEENRKALLLDDPHVMGAREVCRLTRLLEVLFDLDECDRFLQLPTGPARGVLSTAISPFASAAGVRPDEAGPMIDLGYVATPRLLPMSGPEATPDNPRLRGAERLSIPAASLYGHGLITGGSGRGKGTFLQSILRQWLDLPNSRLTVVDTAAAEHFRALSPLAGPRMRRLRTFYEGPPGGCRNALVFDFVRVPQGVPAQMHISLLLPALATQFNTHASLASYFERGVREYYMSDHPLACGFTNATRGRPSLLRFDDRGNAKPGFRSLARYFLEVYITRTIGELSGKVAEYKVYFESRFQNLLEGPIGRMCKEADAIASRAFGENPPDDGKREHRFFYDLFHEIRWSDSVIELETLQGRDDQSAMMMFVLIFFYEHLWVRYEAERRQRPLEHLLVFEEAHRLAGAPGGGGRSELAGESPQALTLQLIINALLEFRKFGLGLLFVSPSPSAMAGQVIEGVDFQVAFRPHGADDQNILRETLRCTEEEANHLSRLDRGNAVARTPTLARPVPIIVPNGRFAGVDE